MTHCFSKKNPKRFKKKKKALGIKCKNGIFGLEQSNFQSECKVGLGLKDPKNYKLQSL